MLRDTSMASTTVMNSAGRMTVALGLETAKMAAVRETRNNAGGTCRRHPRRGPIASRTNMRLA